MVSNYVDKPELIIRSSKEVVINFDFAKQPYYMDGTDTTQWVGRTVVIRKYAPTYDEIVSALIADKYTIDAQISILYNRDGSEQHETEYTEYQSWRAYCKSIAKQVVSALGYPYKS